MLVDSVGRAIDRGVSLGNQCNATRIAMNKAIVEDWLPMAVQGDADIGRSDRSWVAPPKSVFTQEVLNNLRRRGIAVFISPGQVIMADLTGNFPRVRQRRPLAERFVEIFTMAGSA